METESFSNLPKSGEDLPKSFINLSKYPKLLWNSLKVLPNPTESCFCEQNSFSAKEMQIKKDYESFEVLEDIQRSPERAIQEYSHELKKTISKESRRKTDLAILSRPLGEGFQQTQKLFNQTVQNKKVNIMHFFMILALNNLRTCRGRYWFLDFQNLLLRLET